MHRTERFSAVSGQPDEALKFHKQGRRERRLSRQLTFRLLAVLLGLAPFVLAEAVLRLGEWGQLSEVDDPYLGFTKLHPLFELNPASGRYEIPLGRQALFCRESFPRTKAANQFRIFCLGGSTVQGRPYAVETSFTTWLELSLEAADPQSAWDVVNCGGVSYASYRLVPIMEEVLAYAPDLLILYTGHNEFLEARTYPDVRETSEFILHARATLSHSRLYSLARLGWAGCSDSWNRRPLLPDDAAPLLDYRGGLEAYHRDDAWREKTVEHFRHSLGRMIRIAQDAKVPMLICNPVSNVRDCPPFKVELNNDMEPSLREAFQQRWQAAVSQQDVADRLTQLEELAAIDPRHAGIQYELGQCYEQLGQIEQARRAYLAAKDEDICPLRMLERMHEIIFSLASETATPVVDVRGEFEALSPQSIVGQRWLLDHVHPTIEGHQVIADRLLAEMVRQDLLRPTANWRTRRQQLFESHRDSLTSEYYQQGSTRLEGLQRWTQGRAFQVPGP